jgi:hypothetical protein
MTGFCFHQKKKTLNPKYTVIPTARPRKKAKDKIDSEALETGNICLIKSDKSIHE